MTPTIDQMPAGWFVLDVIRQRARVWDWVALVSNQDPDAETTDSDMPALYDRPSKYEATGAFVRIPGKHRNRDAAWDMVEAMISTKH